MDRLFKGRCGRVLSLSSLLVCVAVLQGCGGESGPPRGSVHGKVTFEGKPVDEGTISFIPTGSNQGPTEGAMIVDGEYRTQSDKGPVVGLNRIEITATRSMGKKDVEGTPGSAAGTLSGAANVDVIEMYIPEKYNKNSTLEFDVKPGSNQKDFDLTTN